MQPPGGFGAPPPFGAPGLPLATMGQTPWGIDPVTGIPFSDKSRVVAGLLQIFFGLFGVGRFYTGHIGLGVCQFLFGWLTCGIWPMVDAILMFAGKVTDSEGRPLRE